MKFKLYLLLIFILQLGFLHGQEKIIGELNKIVYPISANLDSSLKTHKEFNLILEEKKIIGLGEATHGTKDFFDFKTQMLKHLVLNHNFKNIVIESDFIGTQEMNNYILNNEGNLIDGLIKMGMGILFTKEFIEMIEWLKEYNLNQPTEKKVNIFGCDVQYHHLSVVKIKEYLQSVEKLNINLKKDLDKLENLLTNQSSKESNKKYSKNEIDRTLLELNATFNDIKNNTDEFKLNKYYLTILEQSVEYNFKKGGYKKAVIRDKFLADNSIWIYNEAQSKMILWAHNSHIAKKSDQTKITPMGNYIVKRLDNDYYSIGFGFNEGQLRAYNPKVRQYEIYDISPCQIKDSYDCLFSKCMYDNFIIDLNKASINKIVSHLFKTKKYSRSIGAVYYPENEKNRNYRYHKLNNSYDALIFFNKTTHSNPIK